MIKYCEPFSQLIIAFDCAQFDKIAKTRCQIVDNLGHAVAPGFSL